MRFLTIVTFLCVASSCALADVVSSRVPDTGGKISPRALADTVSGDIYSYALYSGGNVWLGSNSSVDAGIVAGGQISTGKNVNLCDLYSENLVWLDQNSRVTGRVLANRSADAGSGLTFSGSSWTGKSVSLGSKANVSGDLITGSGNLDLGAKAQVTGNVLSNANIWIANNGTIYGDASPGLKGSLSTGKRVTITGSTDPAYHDYDTYSLPSMGPGPVMPDYGTETISYGNKAVVDLAADTYKDIDMWGSDTTLNLSGGTYTLRDFWVQAGGTVNVDTSEGDVIFNVHNNFGAGKDVTFNLLGDGEFTMNVENEVSLGQGVALDAQVRVWEGDFYADKGLDFEGTIWSRGGISLGNGSSVTYSGVPEPATLALLGLGGFGLFWRTMRKKA